jgi:CBS domain-containing protein
MFEGAVRASLDEGPASGPEHGMASGTLREELEGLLGTVDDVMQRTVITLRPDQPIGEAARELERHGVSGAPVVEGGRVLGIVSLRDLFEVAGVLEPFATSGPWRRYERDLVASKKLVGEAMTRAVVTLPLGAAIPAAASLMRERKVNRIPILDPQGNVRGIVAREDIVEAVARAFAEWHRATRTMG